MTPQKQSKTVELLGCHFDNLDMEGALKRAQNIIETSEINTRNNTHVATVNVSMLMDSRRDAMLKKYIDQSALVLADGLPVVWLSKLLRMPLPSRVAGFDFFVELCTLAARENYSVYLLGANQNILERTHSRIKALNPNIKFVGLQNGYFSDDDARLKADKIAASGADILVVAMGSPRQEHFIHSQWDNLGVKLALPVGGSFDVLAGDKKRAPLWMQKTGMEWFFRLLQDPVRLFPRYAVTNTQFTGLAFLALIKSILKGRKGSQTD